MKHEIDAQDFLKTGCVLSRGAQRIEVLGHPFVPDMSGSNEYVQRVAWTRPVRVWWKPWRLKIVTEQCWTDPGQLIAAWRSGKWMVGVKDNDECWECLAAAKGGA
mgnify:CR=1 FL=1